MSVSAWSLSAALNAVTDLLIPAHDGASARSFPGLIRAVMAGVRGLSDDRGGAIVTGGRDNAYTASSASGVTQLRPGIRVLVRIDRTNTGEPTLNLDGTGPRPWCDRDGAPLTAGLVGAGRFLEAIWDDIAGRWVSDIFGGLTNALFDGTIRRWWLTLPTSPEGIGPNAPWRNGGVLGWTDKDNPAFTIDSPEGRRLTLRLIREALPLTPDGLDPGEPWLNGDTIAFVPAL